MHELQSVTRVIEGKCNVAPRSAAPHVPGSQAALLGLQRRIGNRAAVQLLQQRREVTDLVQRAPVETFTNWHAQTNPAAIVDTARYREYAKHVVVPKYTALYQPLDERHKGATGLVPSLDDLVKTLRSRLVRLNKDMKDNLKADQLVPTAQATVARVVLELDAIDALAEPLLAKLDARVEAETGGTKAMLYGTEFTFTSDAIKGSNVRSDDDLRNEVVKNDADRAADKLVEEWKAIMAARKIPGMVIAPKTVKNEIAYKFTYEDGWWYVISRDHACLETQTKPLSTEDAKKLAGRIQGDIFDVATRVTLTKMVEQREAELGKGRQLKATEKEGLRKDSGLGLRTDDLIGGGHISIDKQTAFGNNGRLLRNFMVAYVNEPTSVWATLDKDSQNAPLITDLPKKYRQAFTDLVAEFDRRWRSPSERDMTLDEFVVGLRSDVYQWVLREDQVGGEQHYQAVNTEHMDDNKPKRQRVEMRRLAAQESAKQFLVQIANFNRIREAALEVTYNDQLLPLDDIVSADSEVDKKGSGSVTV